MSEPQCVEYRPIPGFPGYRIGSDGSVWSAKRSIPGEWKRIAVTEDRARNGGGYMRVVLFTGKRRRNVRHLHRLVLEAFVGPCPEGMEGCHKDDRRTNNVLSNLYWGTPANNAADRIRNGTQFRGSQVTVAVLTEADIPVIVGLVAGGMSRLAVGRLYGISGTRVGLIVSGRAWTHVPRHARAEEPVV